MEPLPQEKYNVLISKIGAIFQYLCKCQCSRITSLVVFCNFLQPTDFHWIFLFPPQSARKTSKGKCLHEQSSIHNVFSSLLTKLTSFSYLYNEISDLKTTFQCLKKEVLDFKCKHVNVISIKYFTYKLKQYTCIFWPLCMLIVLISIYQFQNENIFVITSIHFLDYIYATMEFIMGVDFLTCNFLIF